MNQMESNGKNIKADFYQERINSARDLINAKKDFLDEKALVKEIRNQPEDLPLSSEIKRKIMQEFPELSLLNSQRLEHVFCVIDYFHKLTGANFDYFVNILPIKKMPDETFNDYTTNLNVLYKLYNSLEEDEKEILWFIVILHDIGDIGKHIEHCEKGAELIELILSRSGYSQDNVNLAANVVRYHTYLGMVTEGERTPRSLIRVIESFSRKKGFQDKFAEFLVIFHSMDLAGWKAGKNSLTPDKLRERMMYLDKKRFGSLAKEFWKYRLEQLSREDFNASIKPEFTEKIWQQINQLIPSEEISLFSKHLNETIDIEDCMPIIRAPLRIGQEVMDSAKNFVKMFRLFTQFAELYGKDYTLISSNHYPLEKENEFALDYINDCLIKIPDRMNKDELRNYLEKNDMNSFFGIPVNIKGNNLIFDIDILIVVSRDMPQYKRFLNY